MGAVVVVAEMQSLSIVPRDRPSVNNIEVPIGKHVFVEPFVVRVSFLRPDYNF